MSFAEIFGVRKLEFLGVVCVILHVAVSVEHRLMTETDRQTDRQTTTAYTALS